MRQVAVVCPICKKTRYCSSGILGHFPNGIGRCLKCYAAAEHLRGIENRNWKGDKVGKTAGRQRARNIFSNIGKCQLCDNPATDRHHKDENTINNHASNIMFLCRTHHMEVDGRLAKLIKKNGERPKLEVRKPCLNCGAMSYPLRRGRCHSCNEFFRRNGKERETKVTTGGDILQKCAECGRWFSYVTREKRWCPECTRTISLKKHAEYERQRRALLRNR